MFSFFWFFYSFTLLDGIKLQKVSSAKLKIRFLAAFSVKIPSLSSQINRAKIKDMSKAFDPKKNYSATQKAVGYVTREKALQKDYDRVGFRAGLEVHQQLKTRKKLFCNCPSGVYNRKGDYDAEIIRHMRPTLSELGEYDGTALMEFKTRKTIIYQIKNQTACTYDIDDTPPFPLNREALDIALEIAHLCKLNIVGEVHIIRKQYLDGSIPTGFQRTAILGVEGEIQLQNKKVRLIQLSLEEDSCREVSDIGHERVYQTDRLGMPLIETVTYPDFSTPDEVREGAEYIRFLNRSTGKVNVGIGAGREDVNVSCRGGARVEIKGVAHNQWIPELTHNEVFRQWSLLRIRDLLLERIKEIRKWEIKSLPVDPEKLALDFPEGKNIWETGCRIVAVNLPCFQGILSHFTQPGKMFADELSDRLKVIACIEKPNMAHSEELEPEGRVGRWEGLQKVLDAQDQDTQLLIWGPEEDIPTALETIEERCRFAFEGVPRESRKSFANGTTIFERVLPGPNRMYPDTDSVPIPLEDAYIEEMQDRLPMDVSYMYRQMREWGIPSDTYVYILRNNLFPLIQSIYADLKIAPAFAGTLFGHMLKHIEGQFARSPDFRYERIYDLLCFLKSQRIDLAITGGLLPELYQHPQMDPSSVLASVNFKSIPKSQVLDNIPFLQQIAEQSGVSALPEARIHWIMGQLRPTALGNLGMPDLYEQVADLVLEKRETQSRKAGYHE
jgi:glutamyl-tRNA(Gln) amidotransferase subunit E